MAQAEQILQFWTESGDTHLREKEIVMGLLHLGIQDFSKHSENRQWWKTRMGPTKCRQLLPSSFSFCHQYHLIRADVTGHGFNRQSDCNRVCIVHQKTVEFEKILNFMKILMSVWYAAS